jgi:type II secretory pathway pseudopilin PulG
MIANVAEEGGHSLIELVVVIVVLGAVMGGILTALSAGISAQSNQTRSYQSQQDGKLALDKMRREIHNACTISSPGTLTPVSSVTIYLSRDGCQTHTPSQTVTYCTTSAAPAGYSLSRVVGASCTGALQKLASYLTGGNIFTYVPPNSPVGSSALPRLHVDMTLNRKVGTPGGYRLVDDIAFRNGYRLCTPNPVLPTTLPSC